jgi:transglutaminase-like putative cysteine protease
MTAPATLSTIPWYRTIIIFRCLGALIAIALVQAIEPLGTSPLAISLASILGVVVASRSAHSRLTSLGFTLGTAALWLASGITFWSLNVLFSGVTPHYFSIDKLSLHWHTCLLGGTITAIATWIFWRVRSAITLEALVFVALSILIFAGHRDFHFDRPKIINSLAWRIGVPHLAMLLIVGCGVLAFALAYLYIASQAVRPRVEASRVVVSRSKRRWVFTGLSVLLLGGVVYAVQISLYNHYNAVMLARVANGVGMGNAMGVSPLSFQSALGSTNQPAGLIRLEGDYSDNPFSPMLYLRESALSQFSGKELVFAGRAFDSDLPGATPKDTFTGKEDIDLGSRTPLVQSMYLLADHDAAFAVDYPLSIVQLKNPNPSRFKSAYRAYSSAPAFPLSELSSHEVGDPRWTPEIRAHYLEQHPDKRYKELALEITRDASTPVDKVFAITNYLSRTAIYTLTPNHTVSPQEDPVAPFLFGDHRGYCVHFAHAITYMLRALGIPARIGTGYLTDLSQAKDGHILLRMSDRHAWAEVYITGAGWVPFDVQPDQVESHADTQVDTKLLEELMGNLEPGEEILPTETLKGESGIEEPIASWAPSGRTLALVLICVILLGGAIKLTLRHGWRLTFTPRRRIRWGYISVASRLCDLGIDRNYGETRAEFSERAPLHSLSRLTQLALEASYSRHATASLEAITKEIEMAHASLKAISRRRAVVATLSPASIAHALGGRSW